MLSHGLEHPMILCSLGVIQLLGLFSALATRLGRTSCGFKVARASQHVFFACLGVVAMGTVAMVGARSGTWLTSGTTFSLMVLTAVWDFDPKAKGGAW